MKVFLTFFFLVLACGTAIIGWLYFRDRLSKSEVQYTIENSKSSYAEKRLDDQAIREQDANLYNSAVQGKNKELCIKISDATKKGECEDMLIAMSALEKGDISLCNTIQNTTILQQCKDRLALQSAQAKGDKSLCDSITDSGSLLYCRETVDEERFRMILRNDSQITLEFCQSLEAKFRETCMASFMEQRAKNLASSAIKNDNTSGCELITAEEDKTLCLDTIGLRRALVESDIALCDTIIQEEKKSYCKSTLSKNNETQLFRKYISSSDLEGCHSLQDVTLKNKCTDTVILSQVRLTKNKSLCNTMTNTGMLNSCQKLAE